MCKLDPSSKVTGWFPPVWTVGVILLYMILAGIAAFFLEIAFGFSEAGIDILAIPIAEEALKLWLVTKISKRAFGAIIAFGFLEVLIVKVPLAFSLSDDADLLLAASAITISFLFHVCTALAYIMANPERFSLIVTFVICLAFHILLNWLSVANLSDYQWTASAVAICAIVAGSGWLMGSRSRGFLDH